MKRKKKEKIRCKWNVVEKRALLGDALSPNYPTSLVLLYEITCCRQDAAVACITPHKRTPPQFGHPESRNDSYRLTPKPRITWHTGWPAARQPSILRIYYYSPIGTGGLIRLKDGRTGQKFSTRTPLCESTASFGFSVPRKSRVPACRLGWNGMEFTRSSVKRRVAPTKRPESRCLLVVHILS